jgi:hypothetical protein
MVSRENFYLSATFEHYIDDRIYVFGFLGFLANLSEDGVPADFFAHGESFGAFFVFGAFVADEADFVGMHEVVPMGEVDLLIFEFDPDDLLNEFISPAFHDLKGSVELTVEDPQEDEPFIGDQMQRNPAYLTVCHGIVLKRKLAVRKHEL